MADLLYTGSGRVWTIKFRAGPENVPTYHEQGYAGSPDWPQGDVTKIEKPSDRNYGQWEQVAEFQASPDRPTITLMIREQMERSAVMELLRIRCPFDVQIHFGNCQDPRDFDAGWERVKVFENVRATGYSSGDQGSMGGDGQSDVTEEMPVSARELYDIFRMTYVKVAETEVGEEVVAINVCDKITCGECEGEDPSDGCQKIFALTNPADSSPGVLPQVIITDDQYDVNVLIERWVTTVALGNTVTDGFCVGQYYMVLDFDGQSHHYANASDMIDSAETWTEVTGYNAAGGPNAGWNYSPLFTVVVGAGGYVYRVTNPVNAPSVLDAGSAVSDDLNEVHGWDMEHFGAVGDAGAFVYTQNGSIFSAGTAPVGPTDLYAIAYRRQNEIWVGGDDGVLYKTSDFGSHWLTVNLPVTMSQIDKIVWASDTVGFVAARTAAPVGYVFRTINGGYSWYVVPEAPNLSLPAVDGFNDLDVCEKEVNKLFAGGLADDGSDGVIVMGTDY